MSLAETKVERKDVCCLGDVCIWGTVKQRDTEKEREGKKRRGAGESLVIFQTEEVSGGSPACSERRSRSTGFYKGRATSILLDSLFLLSRRSAGH